MINYWIPTIKIGVYEYDNRYCWYISKHKNDGTTLYLHNDGIWRKETIHNDKYTGFYPTKKDAESALDVFLDSH